MNIYSRRWSSWMATTWIAASTAEESSGESTTAKNATVEVCNLSPFMNSSSRSWSSCSCGCRRRGLLQAKRKNRREHRRLPKTWSKYGTWASSVSFFNILAGPPWMRPSRERCVLSAAATSWDGFNLFVLNWISPGDQPWICCFPVVSRVTGTFCPAGPCWDDP